MLAGINKLLEQHPVPQGQFSKWIDSIDEVRKKFPMWYPEKDDVIIPQWAVKTLCEETKGEAIITTGVGQHQMWAAQWYNYNEPRRWASSGGLGSMGFGLPSALGAAVAYDGTDSGRPHRVSLQALCATTYAIVCGV